MKNPVLIMCAVFAFCTIAVVVGLSLPTLHDEFQYIAAAHLYGKLDIYREFFYSQPPYFPIALHYWNLLFSDLVGSVYVSSRLFNVFWSLLFVGTFMYVLARSSPSAMLCIGVFTVLFFSPTLDPSLRVARNDMMPLALTSSALALMSHRYFHAEHQHVRWGLAHFLAGLLLAAAVSSRHLYATVALALVVASLVSPGFSIRDSWKWATLPLVVGGFVGAAPLLYYVAKNWETMQFSLIEYNQTANMQWFMKTKAVPERTVMNQAANLARELFNVPFLSSTIVFAVFVILIVALRADMRKMKSPHWGMLVLSILAIALIIPLMMLPRPLYPIYLAPLIPFVGICIVSAAGIVNHSVEWTSAKLSSRVVFAGAGIFLVAAALYPPPLYLGMEKTWMGAVAHLRSMMVFPSAADNPITTDRRNFPEVWAAEHVYRVARRLVEILGEPGDPPLRIATLMSSYPIEAGYEIYPEFAGSPFFYRSNDYLSPAERLKYVGVSPLTVGGWLEEVNAEALLVGFSRGRYANLEAGFWDYARKRRFACFRVNLSGAYNLYAAGSREAFLLVLPSRTGAPPDCTVQQVREEVVR